MRLCAALLVALLLAGCASQAETLDEAPAQTAPAPGTADANATFSPLPPPPWNDVAIDWTGNLGERLLVCESTLLTDCIDQEPTEGQTDYFFERSGARLRGARLNLTWEPEGRLTEELGIGLMVMGTCDGCPSDMIESIEGRSPLSIATPYVDLTLSDDRVVHVYVWNASGSRSVASAYLYGTNDQTFTLTGTLQIQDPPSGAG